MNVLLFEMGDDNQPHPIEYGGRQGERHVVRVRSNTALRRKDIDLLNALAGNPGQGVEDGA